MDRIGQLDTSLVPTDVLDHAVAIDEIELLSVEAGWGCTSVARDPGRPWHILLHIHHGCRVEHHERSRANGCLDPTPYLPSDVEHPHLRQFGEAGKQHSPPLCPRMGRSPNDQPFCSSAHPWLRIIPDQRLCRYA